MNEKEIKMIIGREYVTGNFEDQDAEFLKQAYSDISKINRELFNKIPFPVIFTAIDPYKSASDMRKRVQEEKKIYIYTEFSGHPFLDQESNNISRAVHDVYAHLVCGCPFNFQGEYNAYLEQRKHYPEKYWRVLFAEIPGQTSAFYYSGGFDYEQRAIEAPARWLELCKPLKKDYSKNAVLSFKNKLQEVL